MADSTLAAALAEAARTLHSPTTLEETLEAVALSARDAVPGFEHVGISITHRTGVIETKAATDQFVRDLDTLQYDLGEGPCVDAMTANSPVVTLEHAQHDLRWPRYLPQAVGAGLRSQLAIRIYKDREGVAGLNLYSTESDTIDPEAPLSAELFASHAATALGRSRREDQLNTALTSRTLIGQAVGLTMAHYHIDDKRAFDYLIRASSTSNLKLRDIAQEIVDRANHGYQSKPLK